MRWNATEDVPYSSFAAVATCLVRFVAPLHPQSDILFTEIRRRRTSAVRLIQKPAASAVWLMG